MRASLQDNNHRFKTLQQHLSFKSYNVPPKQEQAILTVLGGLTHSTLTHHLRLCPNIGVDRDLRVIQKRSIGFLGLLETRVRVDNSAYIRNMLVHGWDALF
ncbi:hypothetical protein L484_019159 [Morus notabilis]|uniref:Uncharacterized protein n=1 Tax=Morus notabilis TaxID=981085 RepID=W9R2C2_9ROSA|nr:hypothetical protein L484_019159 [Morus notabilis]